MPPVITTQRLHLRNWLSTDADPFYAINQDPLVYEYLKGPMTMDEVRDFIDRMQQQFTLGGYTLWAVEEKSSGAMMGFVGLNHTDWPAHFTPAVEIGWRLGSQYWGKGYATEAAKAVLSYAFEALSLTELVSLTAVANQRSRRVMEKIGMTHDPADDFNHPKLPADHPLLRHVLYRLHRDDARV